MSARRLFLLPGMGADGRMFAGIGGISGLQLHCPGLPDPDSRGLAGMAASIIDRAGITDADWVGGASMGGMVALEIARRTGSPTIVLLGSTCHPRHINPLLRRLAPAGEHLAWGWIHGALGLVPARMRTLLSAMYLDRPPSYYRRAVRAIAAWEGVEPRSLPGRIRHLHGSLDAVILPNQPTVEERVRCGHLVSIARPLAVRGFLARLAAGD